MFDWLANLFYVKPFNVAILPHFARIWWSIECANLMMLHFQDSWGTAHERYLRRLRWTQAVVRKHMVQNNVCSARLSRAVAHCLVCGGASKRENLDGIGETALLTKHAAQVASGGPGSSIDSALELLSDAYDLTVAMKSPELFQQMETIGNSISTISSKERWTDATTIPRSHSELFLKIKT